MGMWIGRNRKARVTYGFDDIALVPGSCHHQPQRSRHELSTRRAQDSRADSGERDGRGGGCAFCHRDGQARWRGRAQPGRRADSLQESGRGPRQDRQCQQGRGDASPATHLHRADSGRFDCRACARDQRRRAYCVRSVRFPNAPSVSAPSRRKPARTFLWCNPRSPPCGIFPASTRPSTSRPSAKCCASPSSLAIA